MADETGWLIELKRQGSPPIWWGLSCSETEWAWVYDAGHAIRFARKIDAENVIKVFGWMNCIATEHIWTEI